MIRWGSESTRTPTIRLRFPSRPWPAIPSSGSCREEGRTAPAPVVQPAEARPRFVAPEESDRVFVDITAYNSTYYYVLGDVLVPGRLPCSGKETVLDAFQYAGGLLPTAEPKDIRLVRPGRNGKPSRVYKVDLEAIQDRGELRSNYQIFPGDRLIVGQNEVVKKTIEIDRLQAPLHSIRDLDPAERQLGQIARWLDGGARRRAAQGPRRLLGQGNLAQGRPQVRRANPA